MASKHSSAAGSPVSPKDRFVTVYGRKPVLEALDDPNLQVDKVVLAEGSRGHAVGQIVSAAKRRDVPVQRASAHRVKVLAGNGRHDQGVLADVLAPRMRPLDDALANPSSRPSSVFLLDGLTTPANVGMILRSATAAGIGGIVLPHRGAATIDPLVVKSSAGVAFHAPVLRCHTADDAAQALREAGYRLFALDAQATTSVFDASLPARTAFVVGSEASGLSPKVREQVSQRVSIPMCSGVESLNVASAAAVVAFELLRRDLVA